MVYSFGFLPLFLGCFVLDNWVFFPYLYMSFLPAISTVFKPIFIWFQILFVLLYL